MKKLGYKEDRRHGAPDFPVEYYYIDSSHPRYEMPLHWHRELEIVRVLSGRLHLYLDNAEHCLGAGEIAFVGSEVLHRAEPLDAFYECVVFDLTMLSKHGPGKITEYVLSLLSGEVKNTPVSGDDPILGMVEDLFSCLREERECFELQAYSDIAGIVCWLFREGRVELPEKSGRAGQKRQVMTLLLDWIEENYTEKITLEQMAAVAGTNGKYLCRFFKAYTGNSPIDYINRLRVERACLYMAQGNRNITEAALDSGFNDISYFCKIFKRYKGVTPREYRRLFEK
ncbi:MAG: helix-turn-helix transcriptional regulator [Clostridia bacterium]|nr:helix-turn-helix transcriptional regulator [Clostridia bacterium]